jgi:hypothetical protein
VEIHPDRMCVECVRDFGDAFTFAPPTFHEPVRYRAPGLRLALTVFCRDGFGLCQICDNRNPIFGRFSPEIHRKPEKKKPASR